MKTYKTNVILNVDVDKYINFSITLNGETIKMRLLNNNRKFAYRLAKLVEENENK